MNGQTKHHARGIKTWAGTTVAAAALFVLAPVQTAAADAADDIRAMRAQMAAMAKRLEELEAQQAQTQQDVEANKSAGFKPGSKLGSFVVPGTSTEIEISGYVKGDFIYDVDESTGDLFVPEAITTTGPDEERFRAHARQSRLAIKSTTPTAWGPLKTHVEGDFFGGGGNEVFSNSSTFRLRHAYGTVGPVLIGQTWSNFMPIESYPTTVDFNGPAGIPFIRQAQFRYTTPLYDKLTFSASVENSEFSGRNAAGPISESTNLGIRAGVDVAPDVTAALTYADDWGLLKLAGIGRYLGSPNSAGDDEFGWGVNVSGNAGIWEGGKLLGSFTYGDGIGRYLLNGFGQDAFVDAAGNVNTLEAYGVTAGISQQLTEQLSAGLVFGRAEFMDSFAPTDLESVNTVHASLFWTPIENITYGGEVIWGDRHDANGISDDAVRLQASAQINF